MHQLMEYEQVPMLTSFFSISETSKESGKALVVNAANASCVFWRLTFGCINGEEHLSGKLVFWNKIAVSHPAS